MEECEVSESWVQDTLDRWDEDETFIIQYRPM